MSSVGQCMGYSATYVGGHVCPIEPSLSYVPSSDTNFRCVVINYARSDATPICVKTRVLSISSTIVLVVL